MNIRQFNNMYGSTAMKSLIRKALTTASNSGGALIPQNLEQVITMTIIRLVPELALPDWSYMAGKNHEFNKLITLPSAGAALGEASTTPIRSSAYQRDNVDLKVMKRKGRVTGFQQDAAISYTDSTVAEIESLLQAFGFDLRTYMLHGNADADAYSFDGIDKFIASKRVDVDAAVGSTSLELLDDVIDQNHRLGGKTHKRAFLMSPEMNSAISRQWTVVRDTRDAAAEATMDRMINGGYRLETYRGIPIIETSGTSPVSVGRGSAVTISQTGTGPIPQGKYRFKVSAVTWDGEQACFAEGDLNESAAGYIEVAVGTALSLTLGWTAVPDALYYKIYVDTNTAGTTSADGSDAVYQLRQVVSAFTYDGDGSPTGFNEEQVFISNPKVLVHASVPTHMQTDLPLEWNAGSPDEEVFLWDLDPIQGLGKGKYTNQGGDRFKGLITQKKIFETDDYIPILFKSYAALIPSFEKTSSVLRRIRTA